MKASNRVGAKDAESLGFCFVFVTPDRVIPLLHSSRGAKRKKPVHQVATRSCRAIFPTQCSSRSKRTKQTNDTPTHV
jgi:hypothetical protein